MVLLVEKFWIKPILLGLKKQWDGPSGPPHRKSCVPKLLGCCDDVHDAAATTAAELNSACLQGEQRVVATAANACAGVEVGAALANDDLAGLDNLAAEALYAQELSVGVAAVASRARTFLMCHFLNPAFAMTDFDA
jgi:hypothetical protein